MFIKVKERSDFNDEFDYGEEIIINTEINMKMTDIRHEYKIQIEGHPEIQSISLVEYYYKDDVYGVEYSHTKYGKKYHPTSNNGASAFIYINELDDDALDKLEHFYGEELHRLFREWQLLVLARWGY